MTFPERVRNLDDLECGCHVGWFLRDEANLPFVLGVLLSAGFARGERIMPAGFRCEDEVRDMVRACCHDVDTHVAAGALRFEALDRDGLKDGRFDPDSLLARLERETAASLEDGFSGLRLIVNMSWVTQCTAGLERLVEFDARLNGLVARSRCLAICRYDRDKIPVPLLMALLATHPLLIVDGGVVANFYFVTPEAHGHGNLQAQALDRCLDALRERHEIEQQLGAAVQNSPVPTLQVSSTGTVICFNQALAKLSGYSRADIGTLSEWLASVYPDAADRKQAAARLDTALGEGGMTEYESVITCKDAVEKTVEVKLSFYSDGHVLQLVDISGRRKAEARYRMLAENVADIIWQTDVRDPANLRYTYVSPSVERVLGYRQEEALLCPIEKLLTAASLSRVRADLEEEASRIVMSGPPVSRTLELEYRRKDGSTLWCESKVSFLRDENGRLARVLSVVRDIDERKRVETSLRLFREVLDRSYDAIYVLEPECGRIVEANQTACAMLGYSADEMRELTIVDIDTLFDGPGQWCDMREHLKEQGGDVLETAHKRKDGTTLSVEVSGQYLAAQTGDYIVSVARDISERRRMKEELGRTTAELVQAGKLSAIGQLAAGLCHELNQPLTAMRSYAENAKLLLERGKVKDVESNLGLIGELLERAAAITGHLKLLAKDAPERREDVSPSQVVRNVVLFLNARADMEQVELIVDARADAVVRGDMIRLEQVCMNIIGNALDALRGRDDGKVWITLTRARQEAVLTFRDNGPGIEKALLGKLFEPFFSVKEDGLGLGLPISVTIVNEHGGTIKAENHRDGGAMFTVRLPLVKKREE